MIKIIKISKLYTLTIRSKREREDLFPALGCGAGCLVSEKSIISAVRLELRVQRPFPQHGDLGNFGRCVVYILALWGFYFRYWVVEPDMRIPISLTPQC